MKKLMIAAIAAVAMSAFAAANDPLIKAEVVKGATYELRCNGTVISNFVAKSTGSVNFQGDASLSTNPDDYEVVKVAGPAMLMSVLDEKVIDEFELPGIDSYADGTTVADGEFYALVWLKGDASFAGFVNSRERGVLCVDEENNWFQRIYGTAKDGKCVVSKEAITSPGTGYDTFEIYLLDTRKPGKAELTEGLNGLPTFVKGYVKLETGFAANIADWNEVKLSEVGATYDFDPSLAMADGFASVYNNNETWTIWECPKAWASKQDVNTVFESADSVVLFEKPLVDVYPVTNEVDYIFDVAETEAMRDLIAKVVAKKELLNGILSGASFEELAPYLVDFTPNELALMQSDLGAWAQKVMPFFGWNADFEVSFDRDVDARTIVLDGQYDKASAYGFDTWVGSTFTKNLKAGDTFRLLAEGYTSPIYVNYQEICTRVIRFKCGAFNTSPKNWGTTMTVKLRLYENTGRCNETKNSFTVGTYKYTFAGPLSIDFEAGEGAPDGVVMPDSIRTRGSDKEIKLPVPTNIPDDKIFKGWTWNGEPFKVVPAFVYTPDEPIVAVATWENAQKVTVTEGLIQNAEIKVPESWIAENVGEDVAEEKIEEVLNTIDQNGIAKWVNYVINQNPNAAIEIVSSEKGDESALPLVNNVEVATPDTGFVVTYALDKVESNNEFIDRVEEKETRDLAIDTSEEKDPTGYYNLKVIVTSEENPEEKLEVSSKNTVGILKVETTEPVVPVAVPWTSLEKDTDVTVAEIVQTSTLGEGDMLHVYNKDEQRYDNWTLGADGVWTPTSSFKIADDGAVSEEQIAPAQDRTVSRGSGVWLERKDVTKPVYLFGRHTGEAAMTEIEKPETEEAKPVYNLIAPTSIEDTDLNAIPTLKTEESKGDSIVTIDGGVAREYTLDENGWGYEKQEYSTKQNGRVSVKMIRVSNDAKLSKGTGFWYVAKKPGDNLNVSWETEKTEE